MKRENVPQDKSSMEAVKMTELLYITDENDNYTTAKSKGWEAKSLALEESISLINERTEQAKKDVAEGKVSPIVYFMELNKMDWQILASYLGMWQFFVKRHAKPSVFKGLNQNTLQKYADTFGIAVEELRNFDGKS